MSKLSKIYFLVNNPNNGSSTLRAFQIADALKTYGYNTTIYSLKSLRSLEWKEFDKNLPASERPRRPPRNKFMVYDMEDKPHMLGSIKNSIVIVLKRLQQSQINYLKRSGKNKLILDPVDYIYWIQYPALYSTLSSYNAIICCNQEMKKHILTKYPHPEKVHVIYHHWDVRLRDRNVNYIEEKCPFGILFSGFVEGISKENSLPDNLNCYYLDQFNIQMTSDIVSHPDLKIPYHYNVRMNNTWNTKYKSNIKLSNAAALGSNIVTTADQSYKEIFELIGESIQNYPYVTTFEVEKVDDIIKLAQNDYENAISGQNNTNWHKGLEIMNKIKDITDLNNIIKSYVTLIQSLS